MVASNTPDRYRCMYVKYTIHYITYNVHFVAGRYYHDKYIFSPATLIKKDLSDLDRSFRSLIQFT